MRQELATCLQQKLSGAESCVLTRSLERDGFNDKGGSCSDSWGFKRENVKCVMPGRGFFYNSPSSLRGGPGRHKGWRFLTAASGAVAVPRLCGFRRTRIGDQLRRI